MHNYMPFDKCLYPRQDNKIPPKVPLCLFQLVSTTKATTVLVFSTIHIVISVLELYGNGMIWCIFFYVEDFFCSMWTFIHVIFINSLFYWVVFHCRDTLKFIHLHIEWHLVVSVFFLLRLRLLWIFVFRSPHQMMFIFFSP